MSQLDLFNTQQSEAERISGMDAAAGNKRQTLAYAKAVARQLASDGRGITADDVVRELVNQGFDIHCLGNAAGSLFRGGMWRFTGHWRKSTRQHAHANLLRIWVLKEG